MSFKVKKDEQSLVSSKIVYFADNYGSKYWQSFYLKVFKLLKYCFFQENLKEQKFIKYVFLTSLLVNLIVAWFSIGFFHYDEHFQILEFALFKSGGKPLLALPWEYGAHIRPGFQPFIAFCIKKVLSFMTIDDPFLAATMLRLLSAILGWFSMVFIAFASFQFLARSIARRWLVVLCGFFPPILFMHARFSSEGWSGSFAFMGGAILLLLYHQRAIISSRNFSKLLIVSGLLLGFSYLSRMQSLFLFPGLFLWLFLVAKFSIRKMVLISSGIGLAILLGLVLDFWLYDEWVNTAYQYVVKNIIEGKANEFGTQPWFWYLQNLVLSGSLGLQICMGVILIVGFLKSYKNEWIWMSIPFILVHFGVSHKEARFLFPLIPIIPVIFTFGLATLQDWLSFKKFFNQKPILSHWFVWGILISYLAYTDIELCIQPPGKYLYPLRYIYCSKKEPINVIIDDYQLSELLNSAVLKMDFYKRPAAHFVYIQDLDSVSSFIALHKNPALLMISSSGFAKPEKCKKFKTKLNPLYFQLPECLKFVDVNGWTSRTSFWRVYELNCQPNPLLNE